MDADEITALLAARHADAVFVAECNAGSAHAGCRRLDAWALLKTWSPPTAIAYEIKVSRQDFIRDRKWAEYMPLCHELYFACPAKLISPEELPEGVGLLWTAGSRLVTKRKAVRHQPDSAKLTALMSYVLMSRSRIVADMHEANSSTYGQLGFWRGWLAEREERQRVGHAASRRLRALYDAERAARRKAETERDRLAGVRDQLAALGYDGDVEAWRVQRDALGTGHAQALRDIRELADRIVRLAGSPPA